MEGYEDQFRQRIAAEIKGEGQELSGVIQHAVPDGAAERSAQPARPRPLSKPYRLIVVVVASLAEWRMHKCHNRRRCRRRPLLVVAFCLMVA